MTRRMNLTTMAALILSFALLLVFITGDALAQQNGKSADKGFVDENSDGINDNAKDADGDGIPNGKDADYVKSNPGKGKGMSGFVDEDGDGINDLARDDDGDGIPNGKDPDYVKPNDGSGQQAGYGTKGRRGNRASVGNNSQNNGLGQGQFRNQLQDENRSRGFLDENGDGINDNMRDADGDGTPNGQDADYERLNPGKGEGKMGFVDEDGDGINDLAVDSDGDGIPNGKDTDYVKPQDGTGRMVARGGNAGPNNDAGTGECDGSGPSGRTSRGGRR